MSQGVVACEITGPVAHIFFDRPDARNAMTWKMYDELYAACEAVAANSTVRVAVLRGRGGKAFVAGTDIAQFAAFDGADSGVKYEQRIDTCLSRLEELKIPTLAVIDGWAVGGGLAIAACCDIRIATPTARFSVPIARTVGNCLSSANLARLATRLGWDRTTRLLLLGDHIDAVEAHTAGFVSEIVEPDQIGGRADVIAQQLAANAPITIAVTKEMMIRMARRARVDDEDLIGRCYGSDDFRSGVRAFIDKTKPVWSGR
jgi:enoyl-CoA hydratase/carnithine racemase